MNMILVPNRREQRLFMHHFREGGAVAGGGEAHIVFLGGIDLIN